ncbi:MAG: Rrf2 family transcriptional regulator [Spirochaetales bacterium]|nr:Rrf2 family transcriptional regulator [Spirochaetales bacterium]
MSRIVNLSESVLIGLHGLTLIAQKSPGTINSKEIARIIGANENTVAKVMQIFSKKGFVNSSRGSSGGFSLAKSPKEISFLDIYETIEGKLKIDGCPFHNNVCVFGDCLFGDFINTISLEFKTKFGEKTLADYIRRR